MEYVLKNFKCETQASKGLFNLEKKTFKKKFLYQ
jgi:hypothetical protein